MLFGTVTRLNKNVPKNVAGRFESGYIYEDAIENKVFTDNLFNATGVNMDNTLISADTAFSNEEVLAEINKLGAQKKGWMKNAGFFAVSLLIFVQIGLIKNGITDVLLLVIVLLVHETGHFIGMRLFGYRNVGMFFVPFFGAAVSGEGKNVASYKKAIVTLLGPMPGLIIGIVLMATPGGNDYFQRLALMFLSINFFNLLPIFPLDGGRLLHQVLFCRNRFVEVIFTLLAAIALIGLGILGKVWILGLLGFFLLVSVRASFKIGQVCNDCKGLVVQEVSSEKETIPTEAALQIVSKLRERIKAKLSVKTLASMTRQVWEKVQTRPPGAIATIGLLGVYLSSIFITLVTTLILITFSSEKRVIVDYQKETGEAAKKEQVYLFNKLISEKELNADGTLYHGKAILYNLNGTIRKEGSWSEGKWDGEQKKYDRSGKLVSVAVFDKGRFVVLRENNGDGWIEKNLEQLPSSLRKKCLRHEAGPPLGPKKQTQSEEEQAE